MPDEVDGDSLAAHLNFERWRHDGGDDGGCCGRETVWPGDGEVGSKIGGGDRHDRGWVVVQVSSSGSRRHSHRRLCFLLLCTCIAS
ncbi:putative basic proline-rich protein-like [Iris pallida]|uniref:Basic proline-rich protein-like n=1 Tax=Iris pallida TaxID=29817 RepID=A0AAX6FHZ1_IRIPA|nr:putative basic proline-rich protein-like [Iris pallida]